METLNDSPFSAVEGAARLAIRDSEVADSSDNTICTAMTVRSHTHEHRTVNTRTRPRSVVADDTLSGPAAAARAL